MKTKPSLLVYRYIQLELATGSYIPFLAICSNYVLFYLAIHKKLGALRKNGFALGSTGISTSTFFKVPIPDLKAPVS